MSAKEATDRGYRIEKASWAGVVLLKGSREVKSWFEQDFGRRLPALDNVEVMRAIEENEDRLDR